MPGLLSLVDRKGRDVGFIEKFDGMSVEDQQALLNAIAEQSSTLIEETDTYQAAVAEAMMTTPVIESIQLGGILLLDTELQLDLAFVISDASDEPDAESTDKPIDIRGTAVVIVDDNGDATLDDEPSIRSLESRGYDEELDQEEWSDDSEEDGDDETDEDSDRH